MSGNKLYNCCGRYFLADEKFCFIELKKIKIITIHINHAKFRVLTGIRKMLGKYVFPLYHTF